MLFIKNKILFFFVSVHERGLIKCVLQPIQSRGWLQQFPSLSLLIDNFESFFIIATIPPQSNFEVKLLLSIPVYRVSRQRKEQRRRRVNEIHNRVINTHRLYRIVWFRRGLANRARGSVIHTL